MRNGICSKCGNATVHMAHNALRFSDREQVTLYAHMEPNFRGILPTHQTRDLWQLACVTCGYMELHVLDQRALAFVRQHWLAVPVAPPAGR